MRSHSARRFSRTFQILRRDCRFVIFGEGKYQRSRELLKKRGVPLGIRDHSGRKKETCQGGKMPALLDEGGKEWDDGIVDRVRTWAGEGLGPTVEG